MAAINLGPLLRAQQDHQNEERIRYAHITQAVQDGNLLRVRQLTHPGNRTEHEVSEDYEFVLSEALRLNALDFFRAFLEQVNVDYETRIHTVERAVEADNFDALEILLQNDHDNSLRGRAVIYAAQEGNGTVECIHWLLQGHEIAARDLDEAIGDASDEEIIEALEEYAE